METPEPVFPCGHPRVPGNIYRPARPYCRTCTLERQHKEAEAMTDEERHLEHRVRYLPTAIKSTREKLRKLENEARRYGMNELLTNPEHLNRAWDNAIKEAQFDAAFQGGIIGFPEVIL